MFHPIIQKKLGFTPKDKSYRRAYLILTTLFLLVFVLLFYIGYNLVVTHLYYIVALEVISLLMAYLTWYMLIHKKNIALSSTLLIVTIFILTLLFIFDQKHHDYALAQAVMLPILAIYLKGLKEGTLFSLAYIGAVLAIAFSGIDTWEAVPFTTTSFTYLGFTYFVVIALIYYYEFSRTEAFNIIEKSHQELKGYQNNLEQKVEEALLEKGQQEQILIQQSKMAMMGEMIASIAHQWKQPLATTAAIIETAKVENGIANKSDPRTEEVFEDVLHQVHFMNQTINDFTEFFTPNKEKEFFSLNTSVDDVLRIAQAQLHKHKISFENKIPENSLMVEGYKNEFSQVLLNIVTNAKDAIVENINRGKIPSDQGKIIIDATINDNKIDLSICDNGGGIPDELMGRIFDAYFTTKKEIKGTGIGLYMSKIIINTHMHGDIKAENGAEGACFHLQLRGIKKET